MPAPLSVSCRSPAMTLATEFPIAAFTPSRAGEVNARQLAVLKTERLLLRKPSPSDVPAMVKLAGDRRVAENTADSASLYGGRRRTLPRRSESSRQRRDIRHRA